MLTESFNKQYELIPSEIAGLFRVRALRDFGSVKAGDLRRLISTLTMAA